MQLSQPPIRPLSELYCPRGHSAHGVAAFESLSLQPGTHRSQAVDAELAKLPLAHTAHGVLAFKSASAVPAMRSAHGARSPIVYLPVAQLWHGVLAS